MGVNVKYDFSEYREFFAKMRAAKSGFPKELEQWLEAIGVEFLNEVREQIISRKVIMNSHLLHSLERSGENNVWEADFGALRLEVGTNLEYAAWVNNGHRTFDPGKTRHFTLPNGEAARFVPGYWKGGTFVDEKTDENGNKVKAHWEGGVFTYDPSAKGGMVLKFKWVEGKHYFDAAIRAFAPQFEKSFEKKLEEWLTRYFEI